MKKEELLQGIQAGKYDEMLVKLYGQEALTAQKQRYSQAVEKFATLYPEREDMEVFSAPGRTEVCGNHTDHQHGKVLAAAINLDAVAVVGFHEDGVIRLHSEGYPAITVELSDLAINEAEHGTTKALIRGMAAQFADKGVKIGGFDAYVTSDV